MSAASQGLAKEPAIPALDDGERIARLRLIRSENVGPVAWRHLIERYGSASPALAALPSLARRAGRPTPRICGEREAVAELEALERLGARPIVHGEPAYPEALAVLPDAPPVISVKGRGDLFDRPAVAIVGARNASIAGKRYARTLARELGEAGFAVVSGLARRPAGHGRAALLVDRFSPLAVAAVGTIALSGILTAALYLGTAADPWATGYGRVLLAKGVLFLATGAVGAYNWRRLTPRLGNPAGTRALLRSVRLELALAAGVLLATAVLAHLALPREME